MNDRVGQKSDNIDQDLTVYIAFTQVWIPLLQNTLLKTDWVIGIFNECQSISHWKYVCIHLFQIILENKKIDLNEEIQALMFHCSYGLQPYKETEDSLVT